MGFTHSIELLLIYHKERVVPKGKSLDKNTSLKILYYNHIGVQRTILRISVIVS